MEGSTLNEIFLATWFVDFIFAGIWHAVLTDTPDLQVVERLLKSWCRLSKVVNGETKWLKCAVHRKDCSLRLVMLLEKYENTIELALACLAGKTSIIQNWKRDGKQIPFFYFFITICHWLIQHMLVYAYNLS